MLHELTKAVAVEERRRALARLAHVYALDFSAEQGIVQDRPPLEQIILLQHVADLAARPGDRLAVEQNRSLGRLEDARDQREQRALAASALANDGNELARENRKRDVLERLRFAFASKITKVDITQLHLGLGGQRRLHGSLHLAGELGEDQI